MRKIPFCTLFLLELCDTALFSEIFVYPKAIESRENDGTLLLYVKDDLTLDLQRSCVMAEYLDIIITRQNESETIILNGTEFEKNLYHSSENRSSLLIRTLENSLEIRGILTDELRITPLEIEDHASAGLVLHKIYEVKERSDDPSAAQPGEAEERVEHGQRDTAEPAQETPQKIPETFTVELCFVTDNEYRNAFATLDDMITYFGTILNAMVLRFADMQSPKISFQLNGVTVAERGKLFVHEDGHVEITKTLQRLQNFISNGKYEHCDVVLLLTRATLTKKVRSGYTRANGAANAGAVCNANRVAIAHDIPPSYNGLRTIAHEMGHMLGSVHDGADPAPNIPGHPGSHKCPWSDRYLMGEGQYGARKYQLSQCTKEQIQIIYKNLSSTCIQIQRSSNNSIKAYPGQGMSPVKFCNIVYEGAEHKAISEYTKCQMKCCQKREKKWTCRTYTMLDGMECGENKTCKKGICGVYDWRAV